MNYSVCVERVSVKAQSNQFPIVYNIISLAYSLKVPFESLRVLGVSILEAEWTELLCLIQ